MQLDVFHAVQRITKKIPKRHSFHAPCLQDLQFVFRQDADHGEKRTKETPDSIKMLKLRVTDRWKAIDVGDGPVLHSEALAEIEKLKVHIKKGCLSGIEVHGWWDKSERSISSLYKLLLS